MPFHGSCAIPFCSYKAVRSRSVLRFDRRYNRTNTYSRRRHNHDRSWMQRRHAKLLSSVHFEFEWWHWMWIGRTSWDDISFGVRVTCHVRVVSYLNDVDCHDVRLSNTNHEVHCQALLLVLQHESVLNIYNSSNASSSTNQVPLPESSPSIPPLYRSFNSMSTKMILIYRNTVSWQRNSIVMR